MSAYVSDPFLQKIMRNNNVPLMLQELILLCMQEDRKQKAGKMLVGAFIDVRISGMIHTFLMFSP